MLICYSNFRFGSGIVIYWFGYLDTIADCAENENSVTVVDKFPAPEELQLLGLNIPDAHKKRLENMDS